ncbi:MAG: divalent-cation tolerance protein CutA [Blastocatellia bacterium]|nr:divalent-cation tolerance protein CutA [Blastocatellia bacterium]
MVDTLVVLTTVESHADAERLARLLVERHLAACVQILSPITSIYRWQGNVERTNEILLLIKTTPAAYPALESEIQANHPYQTPEILALPVVEGAADYLNWLTKSVQAS